MKERGPEGNPNQEISDHERERRRQQELLDGANLLPGILKERMPGLYSQEEERDPFVVMKYFDPAGSWTWYATEGSPVDEDGYMDTNKPKVDYLFSAWWWALSRNSAIFPSLNSKPQRKACEASGPCQSSGIFISERKDSQRSKDGITFHDVRSR
jgi:hypothetical protein